MLTRTASLVERQRMTQRANHELAEARRHFLATDHTERAKRYLRTRGIVVYCEAVRGGSADLFTIGTLRRQTVKQLFTYAERLGFTKEKSNGKDR